MTYIAIILMAVLLVIAMYVENVLATNRDLKRQKQNLEVQMRKEKQNTKIKSFESFQKAKKEQIKKNIKKDEDEKSKSDINLSFGAHSLNF